MNANRRDFLSRALMAGAGASVTQALAFSSPTTANAQDSDPTVVDVDPNFAWGQVLEVSDDGLLTIVDELDDEIRTLRLTAASRIWKGGLYNEIPLSPGDCLYARGIQGPTAELLVDDVWANLYIAHGRLTGVAGRSLTFHSEHGSPRRFTFVDHTIVDSLDGSEETGSTAKLRQGMDVMVVFAADPATDELTATRIAEYGIEADAIDTVSEIVLPAVGDTLGSAGNRETPLPGEEAADNAFWGFVDTAFSRVARQRHHAMLRLQHQMWKPILHRGWRGRRLRQLPQPPGSDLLAEGR